MARVAAGATEKGDAAKPRRLTAAARRSSILAAARRAFTETGDMNGTTIRHIAERGGISEGVIYRHFESKDQLFFEAVVESVTPDEPLTSEQQVEVVADLYRQLTSTLEELLPLLGLVLFGDPKVAKRFYRENLAVAMDRLASAWAEAEGRFGYEVQSPDISVRVIMGMALMMALENHHGVKVDRERAVQLASEGTMRGFFPSYEPTRRKR
jgi:AcrR family transcriptional regulator